MIDVDVQELIKYCNPFLCSPWGVAISQNQVEQAIKNKKIQESFEYDFYSSEEHIERIAYFVINDWKDPIDLDVGVPSLSCFVDWFIIDGNHRFASAIYRKRKTVPCLISGSIDYAEQLLKIKIN